MSEQIDYKIRIDGKRWYNISRHSEYDAIHCVAGAILAGAENIEVERQDNE